MKTLHLHSIFSLLYTQQEIADHLGIVRETYTRACCTKDAGYIDYMIRIKARAIKDLSGKKRYEHILRAIEDYK